MRNSFLLLLITSICLFSCKKDTAPVTPNPSQPTVLLKDIVEANLPSPYYHFEYTSTGKIAVVSFASDHSKYNVTYDGDRISRLTNTIVNNDRLDYFYDNSGKVSVIKYAHSDGEQFATSTFTYDGDKLVKVVRDHKENGVFVVDRIMTMTYYADGNLLDLTSNRPTIAGQLGSLVVDHFEQYDNKQNVDAFGLLHPEFFEHLFLLPGVKLQINNPGKETFTGSGTDYRATFSYTYDSSNAPLTRTGTGIITSGTADGSIYAISATYSYY